jgi:OOP family OmpA-OmpF porin
MNMFKKIAAAAALAFAATSAFAAAPTAFYGGVDLGSTKIDDFGDKASFGGFLGYGFNQNFAIELGYRQLGSWDVLGVDVKIKQTHLSAIGSYPLNPQLDVYGRLGYSQLHGEAKYNSVTIGDDASSVLYGVGLNYSFSPVISGRVEVQKPSSDSTNISVGVAFKF